jgi:hypothetical protein
MKLATRTRGNRWALHSRRDWRSARRLVCVHIGFEAHDDLTQAEHLTRLEFGLLKQFIIDESARRRAKVFEQDGVA